MDARKRKKLEAAGWQVGSAAEFLALSAEEAALVETRLAVSSALRQRRQRQGVTQAALAKKLRSSQSRVAKMEAGDPSISLDLLLRAYFATGATKRDLARVLTSRRRPAAAYRLGSAASHQIEPAVAHPPRPTIRVGGVCCKLLLGSAHFVTLDTGTQ
jgi:transcriptional regulator with XRE-family HTH domain